MNVSVVIPLYNKALHIQRAVDSVLNQAYSDFELIIVDDGSTDGGYETVESYTDSRIRFVRQVNQGVSAARNRGIADARSELVAFLDADDEWRPEFLETVMDMRSKFPSAGLYGTNFSICENDQLRKNSVSSNVSAADDCLVDNYFERVTMGPGPFGSSSVMVPKTVLNSIGGFPVGVKNGEDLHTWIQIVLLYPIVCSSRELSIYHLDAVNRVAGSEDRDDVCFANLVEEMDLGKFSPSEQFYSREFLCKMRLQLAELNVIRGRSSQAIRLISNTADTRMFWGKRYKLLALSLLPHPVALLLLLVRSKVCSRYIKFTHRQTG